MHEVALRAAAELELRNRQLGAVKALPLLQFIPRITPTFAAPVHLQPLTELLERIREEPQKVIVSVPPRHGKSETLLHYMAQSIVRNTVLRLAYASYSQGFSETQAMKAHRYARAAGVKQNPLMRNRKDWQTTDGGGIFATSVGGEFTGRGADLIIVDDPFSNPQQANSPTYRNKVWDWYEGVVETRMEPGASIVILMTRWHRDDLTGRLLKNRPGEYTVVRIPALADGLNAEGTGTAPDPIGREEGEALWPERFTAEQLRVMQEQKPYTFAAMYQGLPRAPGDQVFSDPAHYTELPTGFRTIIGTDVAYSKKDYANSSAAVVYAVHGSNWYVRHVEKWRDSISGTITRLQRLHRTYGGRISVEANGPQLAVFDLMKDKGLPVNAVHRSSDKYAQAQPFAEAWAAGRVLLPDPEHVAAPWYGAYVEEMLNFTGVNDAEDDVVDASVNGYEDDTPAAPDARAIMRALQAARKGNP